MHLASFTAVCFSSRLRIAGTILGCLVLVGTAGVALGFLGIPSVEHTDNEFGEVTAEQTEIHSTLRIDTPPPFGLLAPDLRTTYTVTVNERELTSSAERASSSSSGESIEHVRTYLDNDWIPELWVSHLENDEVTVLEIDATFSSERLGLHRAISHRDRIETDLLSAVSSNETRAIDADGVPFDDTLLYINRTGAEWESVDRESTTANATFEVYNPTPVDMEFSRLTYTIYANDVVVGSGESHGNDTIESQQSAQLNTTNRIQNQQLQEWWITHVQNDETTRLRIEFDGRADIVGLGISVPIDSITYEQTIETNILEDESD